MRTFNYIAPLAFALALTACGEASEGAIRWTFPQPSFRVAAAKLRFSR